MDKKEDAEIEIEDIGTILKSSRLKSERSLEEISSELCIRKIYLTALEEGDYETLPPIPYGVGYVRTYARYLGLNPERAVKLYKAASQKDEPVILEEQNTEKEINNSNKSHIIIGVIVLVIVYALWNLLGTKDTSKVKAEIKENTAQVVFVENTDTKEAQKENLEDKDAKASGNIEEDKTLETETPVEDKKVDKKTEKKAANIDKTKIVLLFNGETWIEVKDKNKVYTQGVFHKGDKKELSYMKNLFISVGRPENIKVYIKGAEKNILAVKRKSNIPLDSLN